jgi:hypothetical protein
MTLSSASFGKALPNPCHPRLRGGDKGGGIARGSIRREVMLYLTDGGKLL